MNRRSFLKFCGIAPVVPVLAIEATAQPELFAADNVSVKVRHTFKPEIIVDSMLAPGTWIQKPGCLFVSPELELLAREIVAVRKYGHSQ